MRGDIESISIGEESNVQDGSIIHADPGYPAIIGNRVIVGHGAIIHGARILDDTLIGMRATILNGAQIGSWCIVGANTLITEGMIIPDHSLVLGSPGKIIRQISAEQMDKIRANSAAYVELSRKYLEL